MARILLPIETKSRELLGKVWLSLNLISEGHKVLIGDKGPIYSQYNSFEPDIFIEKSAFHSEKHEERMNSIKKSGGKIVFLDEEGGVFNSKKRYMEKRSPDLFQYFDRVFAWGEAPANAIVEEVSYEKEKIKITGNPRFDLLQPGCRRIYEERAKNIKSKVGDFILFNTNFSIGNHHSGKDPEDIFRGKNIKVQDREFIDRELINHFSSGIVELLSNSLDVNVVIRPHPSENSQTYEESFSDEDRVIVDDSGDVRPWILAAHAVVHNSCTTGIESVLLNTPTISFQKKSLETSEYKSDLPNIVSDVVYTSEQLSNKLINIQNQEFQLGKETREHLKQYFYNIDDPAAPLITDEISRLEESIGETAYNKRQKDGPFAHLKRSPLGDLVKSAYYKINGVPVSQKKFPGLSKTELKSITNNFREINDFPPVVIEQATRWEDIYWLYSE